MTSYLSQLRSRLAPTGTQRLARHVAEGHHARSEHPLESYQRFALSGGDYKGQLSSVATQLGFGVSFNLGIDLGVLILPWVVRIPLEVSASTETSRHTELVVMRFPKRIWHHHLDDPGERRNRPATPAWRCAEPLVLSTLSGSSWTATLAGSAAVTVGLGDPFDTDGIMPTASAGAETSVSETWWGTFARDPNPRRFRSPYPAAEDPTRAAGSDDLAAYVNTLLEGDVKRRIAMWIDRKNRDASEAESLRDDMTSGTIQDPLSWIWVRWSESNHQAKWDIPQGGAFATFLGALRGISTKDLRAELTKLDTRLRASPPASDAPPGARAQWEADLAMIRELQLLLLRRWIVKQEGGGAPLRDPPAPSLASVPADEPVAFLDIGANQFTGRARAGAAMSVSTARAALAAKAEYTGKTLALRFQTMSRSDNRKVGLVFTQHTQIKQRMLELEASAVAERKRTKDKPSALVAANFGTISYLSACAYWRGRDSRHLFAEPNGSGVSFGLTIEADLLDVLARSCAEEAATKAAKGAAAVVDFTHQALSLELLLQRKLRVTTSVLRPFLATYPLVGAISSDEDLADTSVIVESSFGITQRQRLASPQPDPHHQGGLTPDALMATPWARGRIAKRPHSTEQAMTTLSALRVRYRIRRAEDRTRPLLSFGWQLGPTDPTENPADWWKPNLEPGWQPAALGGSLTRVNAAQSEAIIDLHTWFAAQPQPDDKRRLGYYELAVPAVALFSQ